MEDVAVLVVDDDPMVCRMLEQFLAATPYAVTAVTDSQEALTLFKTSDYDLVITDYRMPEMNGGELARELKAREPSLPICLVTGVAGDVLPEEVGHFSAVLEKPFDQSAFLDTVADLLTAAQPRREHVPRAPRFDVDWRVDFMPLAAPFLAGNDLRPKRTVLRNLSAGGLSFKVPKGSDDRFGAFLIYPPASQEPALMIGEIMWRRQESGEYLAGTRSLFWGSETERATAIEGAR